MKIRHCAMKLGPRNLETDGDRILTFNLNLQYFATNPINEIFLTNGEGDNAYRLREGIKNDLDDQDDRYEESRRKSRRKSSCFNQIATSTNHGPRHARIKKHQAGSFVEGGYIVKQGKGAKCKRK